MLRLCEAKAASYQCLNQTFLQYNPAYLLFTNDNVSINENVVEQKELPWLGFLSAHFCEYPLSNQNPMFHCQRLKCVKKNHRSVLGCRLYDTEGNTVATSGYCGLVQVLGVKGVGYERQLASQKLKQVDKTNMCFSFLPLSTGSCHKGLGMTSA